MVRRWIAVSALAVVGMGVAASASGAVSALADPPSHPSHGSAAPRGQLAVATAPVPTLENMCARTLQLGGAPSIRD